MAKTKKKRDNWDKWRLGLSIAASSLTILFMAGNLRRMYLEDKRENNG